MEQTAPIIVVRKKVGHAAHHGGAWKVAYADFVTAMMALFIVLWLLSSSEEVKKAVGGYFQDPTGNGRMAGSNLAGAGELVSVSPDNMDKLKDLIERAMKQEVPEFQKLKDHVQMSVTSEGLRIELLENEAGMFFESGKAAPTSSGSDVLAKLAEHIGKLPNRVVIEGHTDAKPFSSQRSYTNWELSSDRANAARRLMQEHGVRPDQVIQVRGFADQNLRAVNEPESAANRRVSVIVRFRDAPPTLTANIPESGSPAPEKPSRSEHH